MPAPVAAHSARSRLQALFAKQVASATRRRRLVALELFSGSGRLAAAISELGYSALALDIDHGDWQNLLRPVVQHIVRGWITSGAVAAVWLGTPCSSWSRARHGPATSAWGPLRDKQHLEGLPSLNDRDQAKVREGNLVRDFTCAVVRWCAVRDIPCFVENPISSYLWASSPMQSLKLLPNFAECFLDFCQLLGPSFGSAQGFGHGMGHLWNPRTALFRQEDMFS